MSDMQKYYSKLPPEIAKDLSGFLHAQVKETFEFVAELDKRLTNTNFLTNGGGAVATLAFLGQHPDICALKISLCLFTIGVIATGIEIRYLMKYWGEMCAHLNRRHCDFMDDKLSVEEVMFIPKNIGELHKTINHWAGVVSQWCFILGFVVGVIGFL